MEERNVEVHDPYGFIYVTTNLINGKKYLGQKRFEQGKDWKSYLGSGKALTAAINLYQPENFTKDIVRICYSEEELNDAEYEISVFLDVVKNPNWYNMVYGGGSRSGYEMSEEQIEQLRQRAIKQMEDPEARKHLSELAKVRLNTDEARQRQSEMMKELWKDEEFRNKVLDNRTYTTGEDASMYGYQWSDEQKQHMSEVMKEKWATDDEYVKKVKENRVYAVGEDNPLYGIPKSEETKRKISEAKKGKYTGEKNGFYGHTHTDENKQIMREKALQRIEENGVPFKGAHHSEESKARMRESSKKRWGKPEEREKIGKKAKERMSDPKRNPNYGKGMHVVQLTIEFKFIAEYVSANEAYKYTGIDASSIRTKCQNKSKTHYAGGYLWYSKEEYLTIQN